MSDEDRHAKRKAKELGQLRAAAVTFAEARTGRDGAIVAARQYGCSLREIAQASDLSKDAVQDILDRN